MFEEIDREFFKEDSASTSNRYSSMQAGSKKDFSFAVNHTAEMGGRFWRKSAACVPFQITVGLPFVGVMVSSPDSEVAAATTGGSYNPSHPDDLLVGQHSFIRIFAHLEEHGNSTCGEGCGYWFMGGDATNASAFEDPFA